MTTLSFTEFSLHTGITAQDLLYLIDANALALISQDGQIRIDPTGVPLEKLLAILAARATETSEAFLSTDEMLQSLAPLLDDAVELALQWLSENSETDSE